MFVMEGQGGLPSKIRSLESRTEIKAGQETSRAKDPRSRDGGASVSFLPSPPSDLARRCRSSGGSGGGKSARSPWTGTTFQMAGPCAAPARGGGQCERQLIEEEKYPCADGILIQPATSIPAIQLAEMKKSGHYKLDDNEELMRAAEENDLQSLEHLVDLESLQATSSYCCLSQIAQGIDLNWKSPELYG
eukprot:750648-Hanusia_phi.AAC.1